MLLFISILGFKICMIWAIYFVWSSVVSRKLFIKFRFYPSGYYFLYNFQFSILCSLLAIYTSIQGYGINMGQKGTTSKPEGQPPIDTGLLAEERDPLQRWRGWTLDFNQILIQLCTGNIFFVKIIIQKKSFIRQSTGRFWHF